MNWHYQTRGGHTHVDVFMNGARCGGLVFRNEEFEKIKSDLSGIGINFLEKCDDPQSLPNWSCSACGQLNTGWSMECGRCGKVNPRRAA